MVWSSFADDETSGESNLNKLRPEDVLRIVSGHHIEEYDVFSETVCHRFNDDGIEHLKQV